MVRLLLQNAYFLLFVPLVLLIGCREKQDSQNSGQTANADLLPARQPSYFFLSGMLGKSTARLHLVAEGDKDGKMIYNGTLLLSDHPEPIELYTQGEVNDSVLVLNFEEGGAECRFTAAIQSDGTMEGVCNGFRGSSLVFRFQPASPSGGLAFTSIFADTMLRAKPEKERPMAFFGFHFLDPVSENWLRDSLLREVHGDSLFRAGGGNTRTVFEKAAGDFFNLYRSEIQKSGFPEESDQDFESFNQEILHGVQVMYNENNLLSIGLTEYDYFGGAHGMLFTRFVSFDLKKKQRIRLKDLFKPDYELVLKSAINSAARARYGVENLADVLLTNEIGLTDNFYTTPDGICFNYEPYEIAPFVMGEPRFFIPFSQLKDVMK